MKTEDRIREAARKCVERAQARVRRASRRIC
jgi:hypothetical protein